MHNNEMFDYLFKLISIQIHLANKKSGIPLQPSPVFSSHLIVLLCNPSYMPTHLKKMYVIKSSHVYFYCWYNK